MTLHKIVVGEVHSGSSGVLLPDRPAHRLNAKLAQERILTGRQIGHTGTEIDDPLLDILFSLAGRTQEMALNPRTTSKKPAAKRAPRSSVSDEKRLEQWFDTKIADLTARQDAFLQYLMRSCSI